MKCPSNQFLIKSTSLSNFWLFDRTVAVKAIKRTRFHASPCDLKCKKNRTWNSRGTEKNREREGGRQKKLESCSEYRSTNYAIPLPYPRHVMPDRRYCSFESPTERQCVMLISFMFMFNINFSKVFEIVLRSHNYNNGSTIPAWKGMEILNYTHDFNRRQYTATVLLSLWLVPVRATLFLSTEMTTRTASASQRLIWHCTVCWVREFSTWIGILVGANNGLFGFRRMNVVCVLRDLIFCLFICVGLENILIFQVRSPPTASSDEFFVCLFISLLREMGLSANTFRIDACLQFGWMPKDRRCHYWVHWWCEYLWLMPTCNEITVTFHSVEFGP